MLNGVSILMVGMRPEAAARVSEMVPEASFTFVNSVAELEPIQAGIESGNPTPFSLICCGTKFKGMEVVELGQLMRYGYRTTSIYYFILADDRFVAAELIKNGFNDIFVLPIDFRLLKQAFDVLFKDVRFQAAKLIDLASGDVIEFDVFIFMSVNRKYIRFFSAGQVVDSGRLKRLKEASKNVVFVPRNQMTKFYEFTASRLAKISDSDELTATEKEQRMAEAVRGMLLRVFEYNEGSPFEAGKKRTQDLALIANQFVESSSKRVWYQSVVNAMGIKVDPYSHSSRVATFATLFSMGLGIGNPAEMSLAGLFHDLGLAALPADFLAKPESEWGADEKEVYKLHPKLAIRVAKDKKITLPADVERAIVQHHEMWNGKGYPAQLMGDKISLGAQLLALADRFDYLTVIEEGKPQLKPAEAIKKIASEGAVSPTLCSQLARLMIEEQEKDTQLVG